MTRILLWATTLLATLQAFSAQAHPGNHSHPHDLAHVGSDLGIGIGIALLVLAAIVLTFKALRQR
ncbi:MAG: hypothetical protein AAF337_00300 [Pseudomonadota bacterium]